MHILNINVFLLTMFEVAVCNVKGIVHRDKPLVTQLQFPSTL